MFNLWQCTELITGQLWYKARLVVLLVYCSHYLQRAQGTGYEPSTLTDALYYVAQTLFHDVTARKCSFWAKLQKHKKDFLIKCLMRIISSSHKTTKYWGHKRKFTDYIKILPLRNCSYLTEMPTAHLILHLHGFAPWAWKRTQRG